MRTIKFKAKRVDTGDWVYGSFFDYETKDGMHKMCSMWSVEDEDWFEVYPMTVCQFTGFSDVNNRSIYEDDIVKTLKSYGYGFLPKGSEASVHFCSKSGCWKLGGNGEYRLTSNKEVIITGNVNDLLPSF